MNTAPDYEEGLTPAQVAKLRARTETMRALNAANRTEWASAAKEGLIDRRSTHMEWVASPDSCDLCRELNGSTTKFLGHWVDRNGLRIDTPPAHPGCRCREVLGFD